MSNKLKQLNETRGAKLSEARALLNLAEKEKRELTSEEVGKVRSAQEAVGNIDTQIETETRQIQLESNRAPDLSASEKRDLEHFDLGAALRESAGIAGHKMSANDRDFLKQGFEEARGSNLEMPGQIMLPRMVVRREDRSLIRAGLRGAERRAMSATGQTSVAGDQGGMTIQTTPEGLLDAFYNNIVLEKAGATILEGLKGNVSFPRYVRPTDPTAKTENAAADSGQPNTATLTLSPCRLPFYIDVSEQLLMQSNANIEAVLKRQVMAQLAEKVQKYLFTGSGSGGQPTGIVSFAGIGVAYAGGANTTSGTNPNGSAHVFPDYVNLETLVAIADAAAGRLGYMTNGRVVGQAKQTKRGLKTPSDTVATDSRMIIDIDRGLLNDGSALDVNGYPLFRTNSLPATYTKGTLTTGSPLLFGNWADYFMGFWSGINIEVLRDATLATQGLYRLVASVYYNGGIVRAASFAQMTDINA